jgi:hypothetical protein
MCGLYGGQWFKRSAAGCHCQNLHRRLSGTLSSVIDLADWDDFELSDSDTLTDAS